MSEYPPRKLGSWRTTQVRGDPWVRSILLMLAIALSGRVDATLSALSQEVHLCEETQETEIRLPVNVDDWPCRHPPCDQRGVCNCARIVWPWRSMEAFCVARPYSWVADHPDVSSCCCRPGSQFTALGPEWLSPEEAAFWSAEVLALESLGAPRGHHERPPHVLSLEESRQEAAQIAQHAGVTADSILAAAASDTQASLSCGWPEGRWRQPRGLFRWH